MRMPALVTLGLGLALAGASVYFVHLRLSDETAPRVEAAEPAFVVGTVVVAAAELDYGDRVRAEHLREAEWPAHAMPEGAFETVDELLGDGSEERIVLRAMAKGEPVLPDKVSGFGARATLSTRLDEGKRAYTIRINDVSGVAGFLLPGDRVDILLTRQLDNRSDRVTDVILQSIAVLGIDQLTDEQREQPRLARTATVEVTPEQAQKLALAMQVGTLSLALRHVAQIDQEKLPTVRESDLVRGTAAATPRRPSVRVRRGADVSIERLLGG